MVDPSSIFKNCVRRGVRLAVQILPALICTVVLLGSRPAISGDAGAQALLSRIGPADALVVVNPDNQTLLRKNIHTPLIPASTLKLLTALAVLDTLGPDYRFETHFYIDPNGTVRIRGRGDPLLISEIVAEMAAAVGQAALRRGRDIRALLVDDSYFEKPITIPGITPSSQPYDAPVGAFCVNFNTVNYRVVSGTIRSAEPQTPLLPLAKTLIHRHGAGRGGRIVLSHNNEAIALYGAHLVGYFLSRHPAAALERIGMAPANPAADTLLLAWPSPFSLTELVERMMSFSNNFTANQLLIAAAAEKYGAPGTLANAVRLLTAYGRETLGLEDVTLVEGSGISRQNRLSASSLLKVVAAFEPWHNLLRYQDGEFFKTGTLRGISTRVGYMRRPDGGLYRFVIVFNTPGRSAAGMKEAIREYLSGRGYP